MTKAAATRLEIIKAAILCAGVRERGRASKTEGVGGDYNARDQDSMISTLN